jgi:hypothetical protein
MPAAPGTQPWGEATVSFVGLTKLERAAITIMAGLAANEAHAHTDARFLALRAREWAGHLFDQLDQSQEIFGRD